MGGEEYNWRPGEVLREKHVLLLLRIRHGVLFCYSTVCASLFVALRCLPVDARPAWTTTDRLESAAVR
jgi:hypothetical protein